MRLDRPGGVEAGQQAVGGIVDHRNQHQLLAAALEPVVDGGVDLHQLAEAGPPRSAAAVGVATAAALPQALG